ncbi:MAG: hypothetical protein ACJ8FC_02965 [Sphingomicrobium sp.]
MAIRQLGGVASATATAEPASALINDLRLFALTFAGGFLFVTIFIA